MIVRAEYTAYIKAMDPDRDVTEEEHAFIDLPFLDSLSDIHKRARKAIIVFGGTKMGKTMHARRVRKRGSNDPALFVHLNEKDCAQGLTIEEWGTSIIRKAIEAYFKFLTGLGDRANTLEGIQRAQFDLLRDVGDDLSPVPDTKVAKTWGRATALEKIPLLVRWLKAFPQPFQQQSLVIVVDDPKNVDLLRALHQQVSRLPSVYLRVFLHSAKRDAVGDIKCPKHDINWTQPDEKHTLWDVVGARLHLVKMTNSLVRPEPEKGPSRNVSILLSQEKGWWEVMKRRLVECAGNSPHELICLIHQTLRKHEKDFPHGDSVPRLTNEAFERILAINNCL